MSLNLVNRTDGSTEVVAGGTLYADAPIGSIQAYGGTVIPNGWLFCQGQAVGRTTYPELFSIIGTAFGAGDGSTTFNLPDFRESVPVGIGENDTATIGSHDVYTLGQFKDDQLQEHTHYSVYPGQSGYSGWVYGLSQSSYSRNGTDGVYGVVPSSARTGTTTHGKQLGVNYIIKAVHVAMPAIGKVGSIMTFAGNNVDENWLLCDGRDTTGTEEELSIKYPALYTYLGNSNVLPAQFDHNKLSDYETITLPTSAADAITMQYDGFISTTFNNTAGGGAFRFIIYINGVGFHGGSGGSGNTGDTVTVSVKKGDKVYYYSDGQSTYTSYAAFYKQPVYIKATSASIEVDKDLYATKGYIRDQNVLSNEETASFATETIMNYDGVVYVSWSLNTGVTADFKLNGVTYPQGTTNTGYIACAIPFKKGDTLQITNATATKVAYYKLRDYTGR